MHYSPPYQKLLIACILVWVLFVATNEIIPQKNRSFEINELPENYLTIEGYIVSKRFNSIWLADEPINLKGRVTGLLLSDFGSATIIVSKHDNAIVHNPFYPLKINQKVRVYGDYLRESNPGRISAYGIEVLEE